MTKLFPVAAVAAFVAVGGGWMLTQGSAPDSQLLGAALAQDAADTAAEIDTSTIVDMVQGSEDAPVEVIEYASYTCPHCASFHANQFQELKANYIDTGKVRFVYREIYFDPFGLWASMVARCGGTERFFGITTMLYDQQSDWIAGGQDPALVSDNLRRIGLTAGIEPDELEACMTDGAMAQTLVAWYEENAERDGVRSTPSFIIDGELHSNMSYEAFAAILDGLLEE